VPAPEPVAEQVEAMIPFAPAPVARKRRSRPAAPAPEPVVSEAPAPEPVVSEAPVPRYIVDAPGWPKPGELDAAAKTKEAAEPEPVAPKVDDGWRPYRAVYTPTQLPKSGPVDDSPKWKANNPFDPDSEPAAEPPRIRERPSGTNTEARGSRAREIAEKVREALDDDELPPHFDTMVARMLSAYADDTTAETGEPTGR
jgi:hypothetical protein